jgi:hypothetical protein
VYESLRIQYFLDNRLTDGGDVTLMRRPSFTPWEISGTHFCYRLSRPQCYSMAGRIRSIEILSELIGNRTRNLLACSVVPQPTTLPRAPESANKTKKKKLNSVDLVRKRTIPTERQPLVGEVRANLCG